MKGFKKFQLFGKWYAFTYLSDAVNRYTIGGITYSKRGSTDTTEHWHKVCFGFYRKSDSWIN